MAQTTPQAPKKIFALRTEEEIIKLQKQKDSKKYLTTSENCRKTLQEFCKLEGEQNVKRRCAISRRCIFKLFSNFQCELY